jgi:hypothetical protein
VTDFNKEIFIKFISISDFATITFYRARSSAYVQPQPGGQVSVFMSPSDRVAQLYPQAPGSLFVAFYDSQVYGGGILTFLQRNK